MFHVKLFIFKIFKLVKIDFFKIDTNVKAKKWSLREIDKQMQCHLLKLFGLR